MTWPSVLSSSLLAFLAAQTVSAATVPYTFNIQNSNLAPDGFTRSTVVVNGQFPGTIIQANKDDTLSINVVNQLTDPTMRRSTTVHWHGLFQMRTAAEDGPAFVTQCPIAPGNSYTYNIPLNGQSGTFWYHSHLASQYLDGLRGPLIVYDPQDPLAYMYDVDDANTVIQLGDWYHHPAPELMEEYEDPDGNGHEPIPDSGTINGKGRYNGGPSVSRAVINVTPGQRYRFRIINISGYGFFTFSIQGHSLTIIEVDGVLHQPLTVDYFNIYAGQRYSVVVTANQPVANYWIRAPMDLQHSSDNDNLNKEDVFAVLHYAGAPNAEPTTAKGSASGVALQEHLLKPLENPGAPGGSGAADRVIDLDFTRDKDDDDRIIWTINDIKYQAPTLPTLLKILSQNATTDADFTQSEHTITLGYNQVIELRIHGSANGHVHPFHLHGHVFDVIRGMSGADNYVDPPRRDTVGVGGSEVRIRFRTDNPGPWFLHCHIDAHLEVGLAVVFNEAPNEQRSGPKSQIINTGWQQLCPIYQALPPAQQ